MSPDVMITAIVFFAGQALETAAADSARLIMTGQAQTQGFSQAQSMAGGIDAWSLEVDASIPRY